MQTTASFSTRQPSRTWMPVASGSRALSNQFENGAQAADFNWILIRQNWFGSARAQCSRNSRDLRRVYPCWWRGGQTGRNSAWPWCHVGLPAEYAGPYQQYCIGLLLSSPQDSTTSTLPRQGRSTKTRIGSCVVEDRLLQRRTRRTTCDFIGSSPASHQRRCSLRRQPPTSRPCQPCSARSTLAPNPWANIIQGVPHEMHTCNKQWKNKRKKTNKRMDKKSVHVQKKSLTINLKHHSKVSWQRK